MKWTKYLPVENYTLSTKLSVDEVRDLITAHVAAKRGFTLGFYNTKVTEPYEGEVKENTFTISRVINYRNSFLPIIKGSISSFIGRTQIDITMRPAVGVLIFMSVWLGAVGIACLCIIVVALMHITEIGNVFTQGFSPVVLIPFGMFIFGYVLIYFGFKLESKKSKEFLQKLFAAEEVNNQ
ncbi:hypothetical protein [Ferruginibacter profundus]